MPRAALATVRDEPEQAGEPPRASSTQQLELLATDPLPRRRHSAPNNDNTLASGRFTMSDLAQRRYAGDKWPLLALALAVLASVVLLLALSSGLTFYQDTWAFLMQRREFTLDAFMEPHNEHIVVLPVAIEKILIAIFGMTSATPEYVVLSLMLAATSVLLFLYVRRRLGHWPAVMAAALLLFVGPAWQVLLWPFQIGFVGAVLAGIGMLLALERESRRGDRLACLLLVVSLAFSSLGISFAVAAAVDLLVRRREGLLSRLYVVAVPALLYAAWWVGWGHNAETHLSLRNVLDSPDYLLNGLASSLDTVLGLSTINVEGVGQPEWGRPLLVAAVVVLVAAQLRRPGFSPRLWPIAAATASFWLLAAFNYIPGREPVSSRYAYAGAALLLLLTADLLRYVRFGRRALWLCGAAVVFAIASNLVPLKDGRDILKAQAVLTRADTAAMEIARPLVEPNFELSPEIAGTPSLIDIDAAEYYPAVDEYGSPAYSVGELESAPEAGRRQADVVLAYALGLSLDVERHGYSTGRAGGHCTTVPAGEASASGIPLAPGANRIEVAPGPQAAVSLRRFAAEEFPVHTGGAPGGSAVTLRIPRDAAPQPWRLHLEAQQAARVCQP